MLPRYTSDPDEQNLIDEELRALLGGYDPSAGVNLQSGRISFNDEIEEEIRQERERAEHEFRERIEGVRANEEAAKRRADEEVAAKRREDEEERRQAEEAAASPRAEEEAAKRRADIRDGKLPAPSSPTSPPPQIRAPSPDFPDFPDFLATPSDDFPSSPPLIVPDSPHSMRRALRVAAEILSQTDEPGIFEGLKGNTEIWQSLRQSIQAQAGIPDANEQNEMNEATQRSIRTREEEELEEATQRSLREKEEADLEAARQRSLRENLRYYEPDADPTLPTQSRPADRQTRGRGAGRSSPRQPTRVANTPRPAGEAEDRPSELLNAARRRVAEAEAQDTQQRGRKRLQTARSGDQGGDQRTVGFGDQEIYSVLVSTRSQFVESMWSDRKNEAARKLLLLEDLKLLEAMYEHSMKEEPTHVTPGCDPNTDARECSWSEYFRDVLSIEDRTDRWNAFVNSYKRDLVQRILSHIDRGPLPPRVKRYPIWILNMFEAFRKQQGDYPSTKEAVQNLSSATGVDTLRIIRYLERQRNKKKVPPEPENEEIPSGINEVTLAVQQELTELALKRRARNMGISKEDAERTANRLGQPITAQEVLDWFQALKIRCRNLTLMNTRATRELITTTINQTMQGLPTPEQLQKHQSENNPDSESDALWNDLDEALGSSQLEAEDIESVLGGTSIYPLDMRDVGIVPFEGTQVPQQTAQALPANDESWTRPTPEGLGGDDREAAEQNPGRTPGSQNEGDDRMDIDRDPNPSAPNDVEIEDADEDWGGWKSTPVREGWYDRYRSCILNDARAGVARESDTREASSSWPDMGQMKRTAEREDDQLNMIRWSFLLRMLGDYHTRMHADTARLLNTELQFIVDLYRNRLINNNPQHCRTECNLERDARTCCWREKFQTVDTMEDGQAKADQILKLYQVDVVKTIYETLKKDPLWGATKKGPCVQIFRYPNFCQRILNRWVEQEQNLYPTRERKEMLCKETGMPLESLIAWLNKKRKNPTVVRPDGTDQQTRQNLTAVSPDGADKQKRKQTIFNEEQRRIMTNAFTENGGYLTTQQANDIVNRLGLPLHVVRAFGKKLRIRNRLKDLGEQREGNEMNTGEMIGGEGSQAREEGGSSSGRGRGGKGRGSGRKGRGQRERGPDDQPGA